jgi:hypothetical protein
MNHHNSPYREAWFGREHDRYSREGDERRFSGGYGISGVGAQPSQGEDPGWLSARRPFDADFARWRYEHLRNLDEDYEQWRQLRYKKFSEDFAQWRHQRFVAQTAEEQPSEHAGHTPEERSSPVHRSTSSRHI